MSKKLTTFLLLLVLSISTSQVIAQTTNGIFFQAVARDNFSNPAKDRKIYVQSSIIQTTPTGTKVLTEEHQANTDATGVFSISLGNGVRVGGTASSLTAIDWSKGPFYLNLKVAITPIGGSSSWDYTKEWVDMGTTSFGAVPFALYSASSAKVDDKLNVTDTTKMLAVYAKAMSVKTLETAVASKLTAADTITMLAPYAKAAYTIDSSFFKTQLATKLSLADSTKYVTPTQLASYNFSSGGSNITSITMDTTSLSNRINAKANLSDITTLNTNISSNTVSITSTAAAITAETIRASAAELSLSNNILANTASITTNTASIIANTAAINSKAPLASPTFTGTITAPIYATTPQTLTPGATINWNPANGLNASVTLDQNSTLSFSSTPPAGSYGTLVIAQDATGGRTITLPSTTNKVLGSTSSTTIALSSAANAKDILNFYYDGTNCYWNIGQGYGAASSASSTNLASGVTGTLPVANGGTGATTLTGLIKGNGTSPMTAATAGTDYLAPNGSAANLTNFPTLNQNTTGNAATVTTNANLTGDVTSVGNASTVVKINGTSLAGLSTGILKNTTGTGVPTIAVAGTDYQAPITLTTTGTGAATFSGTTLNIPTPGSIVNANTISGTVAIANGGTGLTTTPADGQIDIGNGTGFTRSTLTAGSGISITNSSGNITIASAGSSGVPYSGATGAVNLGAYDLTVNGLTVGKGKKDAAGTAYIYNTALGVSALNMFSGGTKNTALGYNALSSVTNSDQNIAIGVLAMGSTTADFQQSVAVGNQALQYNKGSFNTALGSNALSSSNLTINATYLVGVGALALMNNSTGQYNSALGANALVSNTSGNSNTAVGNSSLSTNTIGSYNTAIGYNADVNASNFSNATAIGYNARVYASNTIQLGNSSIANVVTSGTVNAYSYASGSDKRLKKNIQPLHNSLDLIMKLNPVHYKKKKSIASSDYSKTENGFIAQELQKVMPYIVSEGSDQDKTLSVDYNSIIPVLTKGIQEQQALIMAQKKQIDEMLRMLEKLLAKKK